LFEIVCREVGVDGSLATFEDAEPFTTRIKIVDFSKSRRDLKHDPQIDIHAGVARYVEWMRSVYGG